MKVLFRRMNAVARWVLLLHCGLLAHAMLNPIDFLALQSIRKGLNDLPGSSYFASWDFTSDPCNFAGVYCDGDRVIALNLGDPRAGSPGLTAESTRDRRNFISGEIPAGLGQLRGLQTLDLSFNQLAGSIPFSIGTLPALSNVILCHNKLTGSVPPFVSQTLTRLDLKHNDLSGSLPPLGLPPSLQYLSLSWNRLSGTVDRVLPRLNQLNYIDLSMNQFTGCIPGNLFSFPISSLQLQRNQFIGPVQPVDQVTIPTVDLSFNRLSGEISPMFSTVQSLYLNNNRFTGQVPGSFVDRLLAANIQILYLQHNYLTGIEINPTVEIPLSSSLCLQYNCMVLPIQTPCPLKAGTEKARPTSQCIEWRG
ncbi:UNVERIFIED_CONTAM: hypothetical protein Slati_0430400 [Sesamum latifolium]|uniref:Leucine-rich repeat-containing N-terminal plant-type domain-containing protein n=1 Tax=Sesamum latifolium TaxID=2727402 RepID=A0AAW2XVM1_9LAMI